MEVWKSFSILLIITLIITDLLSLMMCGFLKMAKGEGFYSLTEFAFRFIGSLIHIAILWPIAVWWNS